LKFWDTSAVVPLLADEARTDAALAAAREDPQLAVWWATRVECASALARLEREGAPPDRVDAAFSRLDLLAETWIEVEPHDDVREIARRLLRVHPLRAADAMQLAAAHLVAEGRPSSLHLITLDERVRLAARKEGFIAPDLHLR
jgi:predicted nucleic acid-binding protein